ncbi:MAG: hypothetical protein FWD28_07630 [Treponema sp.]|nr:hypothetical protein [Treponema sp.]
MAKAKTTKPKAAEMLTKELKGLIPKLDEEGLAFLVKQAHVHLYNMQVDALNQTIINDVQRKNASAGKTKTTKTVKTVKTSGNNGFSDIKISETGSGYHLLCNNTWIAFTSGEVTAMVKIAYGEGTDLEVRGRLHAWLNRERNDLLNAAGIANKFDDKLKTLVSLLKKNFKLKK